MLCKSYPQAFKRIEIFCLKSTLLTICLTSVVLEHASDEVVIARLAYHPDKSADNAHFCG